MKPQTCTSKYERLARWQAAHKQLLQDDAQYRKRYTSAHFAINCLLIISLPFYLPVFGIRLFGPVADISIPVCVAVLIVYLLLRHLLLQTRRIQNHLQSSHDV